MAATATRNDKQPFLDAFARLESQPVHPTIHRLRQAGIAAFDRLGFPGPRDEDWKFTSLAPVLRPEYTPGAVKTTSSAPPSVTVCRLSEAVEKYPHLVEPYLGRIADHRSHPIIALNTAFLDEGLFIHVPAELVVEGPITIEHAAMSASGSTVTHRRLLVVVEKGAEVTLVETFSGPSEPVYLSTAVTEIIVAENASVDHYKEQQEGTKAFHLATLAVQQQRSSRFSTHYFGLGGALSRHEVRVRFEGEGCEATVNGLYQASGTQHFDNHTVIDHAVPHCNSHELYKGVLDGKARGVFTGKIFVRKDAQKTDAKQTNQTLLLSDDATINTKPQLEIFADDVKCTHGATVGQLDEQQLYYLRTRGIGADQARALLTFAFANDIIGRVKVPALRQRLEASLLQAHHLPTTEEE